MPVDNLHVIGRPTVAEARKKSLVETLERTLEEARRGDITEVCMIVQHGDPTEWSERSSKLTNIMTWCGRLHATELTLQIQNREASYE